ncbi:MAG: hypothetical protein JNM13_08745 [Hyphomicrobiaceae bacterium]|nr:hypothetical protein [Hyphomicrobiaceae bacterium]
MIRLLFGAAALAALSLSPALAEEATPQVSPKARIGKATTKPIDGWVKSERKGKDGKMRTYYCQAGGMYCRPFVGM